MKARQVLLELFGESAVDITRCGDITPGVTASRAGFLNGYPTVQLELETLEGEYEDYRMNVFVNDKLVYEFFAGDLDGDNEPLPRVRIASCRGIKEEGEEIFLPHTSDGLALAHLIVRFCELSQGTVPTT